MRDWLRSQTCYEMTMKKIEPTPEDYARAEESLQRDPRELFLDSLARHEARRRIERERHERRRRLINRLSLGLLARD